MQGSVANDGVMGNRVGQEEGAPSETWAEVSWDSYSSDYLDMIFKVQKAQD